MKYILTLLFFSTLVLEAKYLDNHSCKECHEEIYKEFESSAHAKSFFNDELHRKVALHVSKKKYECAICHMPMANNLKDLINGKARPNPKNVTQSDAISCYFCHTIAYVKKAHKFNLNQKAKQAKNYKPSFFANLKNPDENDKHSSLHNPIYSKVACIGCHSHKLNDLNVTIFKATKENQNSQSCIKCHMPYIKGGAEKINKRARMQHKSHKFLGIRDAAFRKKGVDINITTTKDGFNIMLKNKMGHPLIIQPARVKYLQILVKDGNKTIWQNYKKQPSEDKQGYFAINFKKDGKNIVIPNLATSMNQNNLEANSTKTLHYKCQKIKDATKIEVNFFVKLAKDNCLKIINLKDKSFNKAILIKKVEKTLNK